MRPARKALCLLGIAFGCAVATATTPSSADPARLIQPIVRAPSPIARDVSAWRSQVGATSIYIPPTFVANRNGTYDVMIHFHGASVLQEQNIERAGLNVVVASVNLGVSSGTYENSFRAMNSLEHLLDTVDREVQKSGRAPNTRTGR